MKYVALFLAIIVAFLPLTCFADELTDQLDDTIGNALDSLDFSELEDYTDGQFGSITDRIHDVLDGKFEDVGNFLEYLVNVFFGNFKSLIPSLASVLVICILCGIVKSSNGGFISQSTDKIINFVGYATVALTLVNLIVSTYGCVTEFFNNVSSVNDICMPIMLTLVVANGGNACLSVYQPAIVMFSSAVIGIVQNVVMPLSIASVVLCFVSNVSDNISVNKLTETFGNIAGWILGIVFMLYSAFVSVEGITANAIDGVSIRAMKFATKNYIPLLGGYLSDGFDMIVASTSLIKNAFGVVTLVVLVYYVLTPIVSVLSLNFGLQIVASVAEPVADSKLVKVLSDVGKKLTFWAVAVIAVAFMSFILIMLTVFSANGGVS